MQEGYSAETERNSQMVNKKRLTEEFLRLAAFDSESFNEGAVADHLAKRLEDLGLKVIRDGVGRRVSGNSGAAGNIYGFLVGNSEGDPVLFSAHMDTVTPGRGKKPVIGTDGKVTSSGDTVLGADDVTGISAILEMLEVIKENDLQHPDIEVVFFAAEEVYCVGSSGFDYSLIRSRMAYVLDLDGPVGRIANRAPSIIQFETTVLGKSAHAGFEPEKGVSAISIAARAIDRLKTGRIDGETTANIGIINGGTGKNVVPEAVRLEGEVRSLNDARAQEITETIRREFEKAAEEFGGKAVFRERKMITAYVTDPGSKTVRAYREAIHFLGYGEAELVTTFGGSDNNNLCLHGIEGVVISNAMNKVHTMDEYFYIDEFVKSAEIVVKLATACKK